MLVGAILVDEMSLSEAVALNQRTMQFDGFVDLGEYTPHNQASTRAGHPLVLMIHPFTGTWVQVSVD